MKKLIIIAAVLPLASCATVIRGTKEKAKFESQPPGATVTAESISADKLGPFDCVTPCEMNLKRKRDWNVVFELDGYKPASGVLSPKVTGGGVASGAGNILAGGIIGIGVDAGTGANLDLRPNPMQAVLVKEESEKLSYVISGDEGEEEIGGAAQEPGEETPAETLEEIPDASESETVADSEPALVVEPAIADGAK